MPVTAPPPLEPLTRSRCMIELNDGLMRWSVPIADPHRWVIDMLTLGFDEGGALARTTFRCLRCGEELEEERPFRPGDELGGYLPSTVLNWDGSAPVAA